jgi:hypothetical protein
MSDSLVSLLEQTRKAHRKSQAQVEVCMELPQDTYRHIEHGRRPLPDIRNGLTDWMLKFEECIQASTEEREKILQELSRVTLEQFERLLKDIERRKRRR